MDRIGAEIRAIGENASPIPGAIIGHVGDKRPHALGLALCSSKIQAAAQESRISSIGLFRGPLVNSRGWVRPFQPPPLLSQDHPAGSTVMGVYEAAAKGSKKPNKGDTCIAGALARVYLMRLGQSTESENS